MTDTDDKYITLKRSDLDKVVVSAGLSKDLVVARIEKLRLKDAVVIRRQDVFASPCLFTYANMIALVAKNIDDGDQGKALMRIADYFHDQAVLAAEEGFKLPDV